MVSQYFRVYIKNALKHFHKNHCNSSTERKYIILLVWASTTSKLSNQHSIKWADTQISWMFAPI